MSEENQPNSEADSIAHGDCRPVPCSVGGVPGVRLWVDKAIAAIPSEQGEWRIRMPDPDADEVTREEEEGSLWISQEVIDAIISSQNSQDRPPSGSGASTCSELPELDLTS